MKQLEKRVAILESRRPGLFVIALSTELPSGEHVARSFSVGGERYTLDEYEALSRENAFQPGSFVNFIITGAAPEIRGADRPGYCVHDNTKPENP